MHFDATTPAAAAPGDMWWSGGKLALAIDDLTSIQWVQVSSVSDTVISGSWDFPDAPAVGEAFTPSGSSAVLTWNGTMWTFPMGGGGGGISVADAPPTGVPPNSLWWDSDSGDLFVNYNDADSTQWVQINTAAPAPPASIADAPSDGTPYSRQDAGWVSAAAGGGGLTEADADLRYLQLTGGILAGSLFFADPVTPATQLYRIDGTATGFMLMDLTLGYAMHIANRIADFALQPTVAGVPIVMATETTALETRLIDRICLLEERLAKLEAR